MDYIYLIIGLLLTIVTILNLYLIYRRPEGYGSSKTLKIKHLKLLYIIMLIIGIYFIIRAFY